MYFINKYIKYFLIKIIIFSITRKVFMTLQHILNQMEQLSKQTPKKEKITNKKKKQFQEGEQSSPKKSPNYTAKFEQQITSISIGLPKTSEELQDTDREREIEKEFFKNYKNITMPEASFEERMMFDIYKRATRDQRMDILKDMVQPKISKHEKDALYKRLIEDAGRWNTRKKQLENFLDSEFQKSHKEERKMSAKESDELYSRFMRQYNQTQEVVHSQRNIQEHKSAQEELRSIQNMQERSLPSSEINAMLRRFELDAIHRKKTQEAREALKEDREQQLLSTYFKPQLTPSRDYQSRTLTDRLFSSKTFSETRSKRCLHQEISTTTIKKAFTGVKPRYLLPQNKPSPEIQRPPTTKPYAKKGTFIPLPEARKIVDALYNYLDKINLI